MKEKDKKTGRCQNLDCLKYISNTHEMAQGDECPYCREKTVMGSDVIKLWKWTNKN